jgi:hypothetical protein
MRNRAQLIATRGGATLDTHEHTACQAVRLALRIARLPCSSNRSVTIVTSVTYYTRARIRLGFPVTGSVTASGRSCYARNTASAGAQRAEAANSAMATAARSLAARSRRAPRPLRCEDRGPHSAAGAPFTPQLRSASGWDVSGARVCLARSKHVAGSVTSYRSRGMCVRPRLAYDCRSRRRLLGNCRAAFHVEPGEGRA